MLRSWQSTIAHGSKVRNVIKPSCAKSTPPPAIEFATPHIHGALPTPLRRGCLPRERPVERSYLTYRDTGRVDPIGISIRCRAVVSGHVEDQAIAGFDRFTGCKGTPVFGAAITRGNRNTVGQDTVGIWPIGKRDDIGGG